MYVEAINHVRKNYAGKRRRERQALADKLADLREEALAWFDQAPDNERAFVMACTRVMSPYKYQPNHGGNEP